MKKSILIMIMAGIFLFSSFNVNASFAFSDLKKDYWAYDSIMFLNDKKIISGYTDGSFRPLDKVSYEEFLIMVVTASSIDKLGSSLGKWASIYYLKAVKDYVKDAKISSDKLSQDITRGEMAFIISKFLHKDLTDLDIEKLKLVISDWEQAGKFSDEVFMVYAMGILGGYPDATFRPHNTLNRAEAAVIVEKIINKNSRLEVEALKEGVIVALKKDNLVIMDGENKNLQAYSIDGLDYYRLKDIGFILNGTIKQFNFEAIKILNGEDVFLKNHTLYEAKGEELENIGEYIAYSMETKIKLYLNGEETSLKGYLIGQDYYFTLEGLGQILDFGVNKTQENVINVSTNYGDTTYPGKIAYLTFDDYVTRTTSQILDNLAKYNIKATFFVATSNLNKEVLLRIAKEGHAIGNHSYSHDYPKIYANSTSFWNDFLKQENFLESVIGYKPTIIRFPGGSTTPDYYGGDSKKLIKEVSEHGYRYFDWNTHSRDDTPKTLSKDEIVNNVITGAKGKNLIVILCHMNARNTTTAEALPEIITSLQQDGFTFLKLAKHSPQMG